MPNWSVVKDDPELKKQHNERCRILMKTKYDTDPVYREYMREKARKRKAMLKEQKKNSTCSSK